MTGALAFPRVAAAPRNAGVPRIAEFFAGIGLVRLALERAGFSVVFAHDVDPVKRAMYAANFDSTDFVLGDIRALSGRHVPDVELATASFPCTDLSLAGGRRGLSGEQSGMFWEFARVLEEMGLRRPPAVLIENVPGFGTSRGGRDLTAAIARLNSLGYWCDLMVINAKTFTPQSRPRLFMVGSREAIDSPDDWWPSAVRPAWIGRVAREHPALRLRALPLTLPTATTARLDDVVGSAPYSRPTWWDEERLERFLSSLSPLQAERLQRLREGERVTWTAAYRRTRAGRPVWELRRDEISGCLRAVRGGSSKQALVRAGRGNVRVRWMTPREYARLQGADEFRVDGVTVSQALFGLGDAVCVPAVQWLAKCYLAPLLRGELAQR